MSITVEQGGEDRMSLQQPQSCPRKKASGTDKKENETSTGLQRARREGLICFVQAWTGSWLGSTKSSNNDRLGGGLKLEGSTREAKCRVERADQGVGWRTRQQFDQQCRRGVACV